MLQKQKNMKQQMRYVTKKNPSQQIVMKDSKVGRLPALPHCGAVPSAQAGLTSLFGMGRGGAPPLWPP